MSQSIIIIRHADDLDSDWPLSSDVFTLPSGDSIEVPQHGLTDEGFARARLLATAIPQWTTANGIDSITRVITKDPSLLTETPNPFDTIRPFIMAQNIMDVELLPDLPTLTVIFKNNQLLPSYGSLLICWDAEGIWGDKINGKRPPVPAFNSILGMLKSTTKIDDNSYPEKAGTIYSYTNGKKGVYNLSVYTFVDGEFV